MAIIKAPFTPEQVENLNRYQRAGVFHPFTCGNKDKYDHPDDVSTILIATEKGWVCSRCDYTQDWAHEFMTLPPNRVGDLIGAFPDFPEMSGEEAREYLKREGYDPDEIAKHGVAFVRMASLVAKIRNIVYQDEIPAVKYLEIQQLIKDYEEETKDEDSSPHNEGEAADNDV